MSWWNCGSLMPNDCAFRNISQSCHRPIAGAANSIPMTTATATRNSRSRRPKKSWKRSTAGWMFAENATGERRSAISTLTIAIAENAPANSTNNSNLVRRMPQNTSPRPSEMCHR